METIYVILIVVSIPLSLLLIATAYYLYKKYNKPYEAHEDEITFPHVRFSNLLSFNGDDGYQGSDYSLI